MFYVPLFQTQELSTACTKAIRCSHEHSRELGKVYIWWYHTSNAGQKKESLQWTQTASRAPLITVTRHSQTVKPGKGYILFWCMLKAFPVLCIHFWASFGDYMHFFQFHDEGDTWNIKDVIFFILQAYSWHKDIDTQVLYLCRVVWQTLCVQVYMPRRLHPIDTKHIGILPHFCSCEGTFCYSYFIRIPGG